MEIFFAGFRIEGFIATFIKYNILLKRPNAESTQIKKKKPFIEKINKFKSKKNFVFSNYFKKLENFSLV